MTKFMKNLNEYLTHYNIKNSFVSKITGIEKNKLSRLLNNKQGILYEDMELIAKSLGKDISYFMQENLTLKSSGYEEATSIAFYMGAVDEDKKILANEVFDFLEHVDAILGIQKKIDKNALEVVDYEF